MFNCTPNGPSAPQVISFLQAMKNSAARVTEIPLKRMRDRVFFIHFPLKWYRLIGILYIESILL